MAVQVLNALAPCQQEQGDLSGAEAMLRSSVILAKHQQDLTSQVTGCQRSPLVLVPFTLGGYVYAPLALWRALSSIGRIEVCSSFLPC